MCKATEDPVFEVFENETLTMAMGLLTAILTGAMQVKYFLTITTLWANSADDKINDIFLIFPRK